MIPITHNNLPEAVQQLIDKVDSLQRAVNSKSAPSLSEENDLISAEQAAEYLGKALPTIYGLVHRNAIPHLGKRKHLRFSKSDLKNWLVKSVK